MPIAGVRRRAAVGSAKNTTTTLRRINNVASPRTTDRLRSDQPPTRPPPLDALVTGRISDAVIELNIIPLTPSVAIRVQL